MSWVLSNQGVYFGGDPAGNIAVRFVCYWKADGFTETIMPRERCGSIHETKMVGSVLSTQLYEARASKPVLSSSSNAH